MSAPTGWEDFEAWYAKAYGTDVYGTSHKSACKAAWCTGARVAIERYTEAA